jgi:hypothetical protein
MKKLIVSVIAIATLSLSALGQAPEGFKYQAVVRDGGNIILNNQAVGMQLEILQGGSAGTPVYTETFATTTNAYGLVNLEIGTGLTTDDFSTIDWGNSTYFIRTSADLTGGTSYVVMGTSQLMSVPYALHAKTAQSSIIDNVDDADSDPTNELQDWSSLPNIPADIADGDDVNDADSDPANELQDWSSLPNIPADIADGDDVDDADADPANELQDISLSGSNLTISSGSTINLAGSGITYKASLSPLASALTESVVAIGDMEFRYSSNALGGFLEARYTGAGFINNQVYCEHKSSSSALGATVSVNQYTLGINFNSDWGAAMQLWNGSNYNDRSTVTYYQTEIYEFVTNVPVGAASYKVFLTITGAGNVYIRAEHFAL